MRSRVGVLLACLAVVAAAGCGSEAHVGADGGSAANGKQLFINGADGKQSCGSCHTLADAGTTGVIGPNLDDAYRVVRGEHGFDESTIRDVVRGQIAYPTSDPPSPDAPGMPADLVTGQDADDVATYVASVAGLPVQGGETGTGETDGGEGEAADGKTIFTQHCGSCHVFSDAGTNGTIGPNLDEAMPTVEEALRQVRNGGGGMPAFEGQLSEEQIRAVSEYVAGGAGG